MNMAKLNLYATIMPYDLNLALSFHSTDTIGDIHFFIEETFKKLRIKYKVGRIELKNNKAWLLPQYVIGDFLNAKDEIVVYSIEYGIRLRELPEGNAELEEIDELFIGKKLKRKRDDEEDDGRKSFMKSKALSMKAKQIRNNLKLKSDKDDSENSDDEEKEKDNNKDKDKEEQSEAEGNDKKKESNEDNGDSDDDNKGEEGKSNKSEEDDNDDDDNEEDDKSGSNKEDDIQLVSNKKK